MEVTLDTQYVTVECTITHASMTGGEFEDFELVPDTEIRTFWKSEVLTDETFESYLAISVALYNLINWELDKADFYEEYAKEYDDNLREAEEDAHWQRVDREIDDRKEFLRSL